ncbi:MAG: ornithine cyclodeaminase family protein [Pyrinomonadaceae bacterium]
MSEKTKEVLVLTAAEINELMPMGTCIGVMRQAFKSLAQNDFHQPLRTVVRPPEASGSIVMMPTYRQREVPAFGLKAICVFPANAEKGMDAHQGAVMLFSGTTGELQAMMNASAITAIRTAAVSAVATDVLAREDANELAIVGTGVQARAHLSALFCVRRFKRVRIAGKHITHTKRFVEEMSENVSVALEPVELIESAVRAADVIVTATNAQDPVLRRDWVASGAHINAIGTYSPQSREIDSTTMAAARIFVDRRESAENEAGDYLLALQDGAIDRNSIVGELGEVLLGKVKGRTSRDEITLFKSLGLAIEDLACAEFLFAAAKENRVGTIVDL